jgi:phosphoribosylaminoimidazole-succinocarboxamide synthase
VQMPKGVPVATVGVDNAANAAWLAIRILNAIAPFQSNRSAAETARVWTIADVQRIIGETIAQGKTKTLYETSEEDCIVMKFRDDVTANNGEKHQVLEGKGVSACAFNTLIMEELAKHNIPTHFLGAVQEGANDMAVVRRLSMIPLEAVVRNLAAGSLCRRLGIEKGRVFNPPLFELFYKSDELNDPLVTTGTAVTMGWASEQQLAEIECITRKVNEVVSELLLSKGIHLVDFKIEFGVTQDGKLVVGDEFSPDSCRMYDAHTGASLDKDVFRLAVGGDGNLLETYRTVLDRVGSNPTASATVSASQ